MVEPLSSLLMDSPRFEHIGMGLWLHRHMALHKVVNLKEMVENNQSSPLSKWTLQECKLVC